MVAWEDMHQDPNLSRALARILMAPLSFAGHIYKHRSLVFIAILAQLIVVHYPIRLLCMSNYELYFITYILMLPCGGG